MDCEYKFVVGAGLYPAEKSAEDTARAMRYLHEVNCLLPVELPVSDLFGLIEAGEEGEPLTGVKQTSVSGTAVDITDTSFRVINDAILFEGRACINGDDWRIMYDAGPLGAIEQSVNYLYETRQRVHDYCVRFGEFVWYLHPTTVYFINRMIGCPPDTPKPVAARTRALMGGVTPQELKVITAEARIFGAKPSVLQLLDDIKHFIT